MTKTTDGTNLERAKAKAEEQRRFRRYAVNFPCLVKPRGAREAAVLPELQSETYDVSRGGLFFVASADWKVGTAIECELRLPVNASAGRPVGIRCGGTIARVVPQEEGRVGVGATIKHYEFFHLGNNGERRLVTGLRA